MPQRRLATAVVSCMTCCLLLAASVGRPQLARGQEKADDAKAVGVVKGTFFLGPFE